MEIGELDGVLMWILGYSRDRVVHIDEELVAKPNLPCVEPVARVLEIQRGETAKANLMRQALNAASTGGTGEPSGLQEPPPMGGPSRRPYQMSRDGASAQLRLPA